MDHKKLAAVFTFLGKHALANKVCKEKIAPKKETVSVLFADGSKETFRQGSIVRVFYEYLSEKSYMVNSEPPLSVKFYPLTLSRRELSGCPSSDDCPNQRTTLLLFYAKERSFYGQFLSSGIEIHSYKVKDPYRDYGDLEVHNHYTYWKIYNLDLEFAADPNLVLAMIIGLEDDVSYGRLDRVLNKNGI